MNHWNQILNLRSSLLLGGASLCFAGIIALVAARLIVIDPLPSPSGGRSGEKRRAALSSPLFRLCDPLIRFLGALFGSFSSNLFCCSSRLRQSLDRAQRLQVDLLMWAGDPFGLRSDEVLGLSAFLALLGATSGIVMGLSTNTWVWVFPGACVFGVLPNARLQSLMAERRAEVARELPAVIDLTALSMGAGLDFPGALRKVTEGQSGVVSEELRQVLLSLELGITRRAALLALQNRVPVPEVRDLVRAILMAEKKGASVTEALEQQAKTSRQRRSVRAEEAAARASVLLLLPLMLLMACILVMLVGPLMSSGVGL